MHKDKKKKQLYFERNYLFIIICIFIVVQAYCNPNRIIIKMVYIIGSVIAILMLHLYMSVYWIGCEVQPMRQEIYKGDRVCVKIRIYNKSILPTPYIHLYLKNGYRFTLQDNNPVKLLLGPKEECMIEVNYRVYYCGKQFLGVDTFRLVDYFHIHHKEIIGTMYIEAGAAPKIKELKNEISAQFFKNIGGISSRIFSQEIGIQSIGERGDDLRTYEIGDRQRDIHWKLLAQKDVWMVKERLNTLKEADRVVVIMDPRLSREKNERQQIKKEDHILTYTLSYIYKLVMQGRMVEFFFYVNGQWRKYSICQKEHLKPIGYYFCKYEFILSKENQEIAKSLQSIVHQPLLEKVPKIVMTALKKEGLKGQFEHQIMKDYTFQVLHIDFGVEM